MPSPPNPLPQSFQIDRLGREHAAAIAELHQKCFFSDGWSVQSVEETFDNLAGVAFGIWQSDTLIGFAIITICLDEAELVSIATNAALRGQGIGRKLLDRAVEHCRAEALNRLMLEVAADNDPALALYRNAGFETDGTRPRYYRRKNAPDMDAVLMSLAL